MPRVARPAIARFFEKISPCPITGCWWWTDMPTAANYGQFLAGGTMVYAHRFSWFLAHGFYPEPGVYVCHRCDQTACVNPAHLFLGTQSDNLADMVRKGRSRRGEKNVNAKLTANDILSIRARYVPGKIGQGHKHQQPNSAAALAREFNVSRVLIRKIVQCKTWRHV